MHRTISATAEIGEQKGDDHGWTQRSRLGKKILTHLESNALKRKETEMNK